MSPQSIYVAVVDGDLQLIELLAGVADLEGQILTCILHGRSACFRKGTIRPDLSDTTAADLSILTASIIASDALLPLAVPVVAFLRSASMSAAVPRLTLFQSDGDCTVLFATFAAAEAVLDVANLKVGLLRVVAALDALKPSAWMLTSTPAFEAVAFPLMIVVNVSGAFPSFMEPSSSLMPLKLAESACGRSKVGLSLHEEIPGCSAVFPTTHC